MKISPVNLYTPKAKTKVSYKGGHPHPPVGNDEGNKTEALSKHNKKRSVLRYRSTIIGTIAGLVVGGAFMAYKDDVIGTIKNASYQNDLVSNPEKTAREFLDDLVISNETPSEKTDEITVIQNIGDENFVEIEKLKKDKTTVRYKIEMPEGVDGSVDYEKIENTSLKDLIEQNKVSQAAIDINSDGNEEISFSFENGDVNNTTVKFDTDSDGILDKKVTIQIVDYKK